MMTIVTEFGKFRYNCLLIGIFTLVYIFQFKVYYIPGDIKGIKTYIDYILALKNRDYINTYTI